MDSREQRLDEQQLRTLSTTDLVRHALEEARLLAKAEVLHAKQELKQELKAAKLAGILFGTGAAGAICGLSVLLVALALALPLPEPLAAVIVGVALLVAAGVCAAVGWKSAPRKPLSKTQERVKRDIAVAREQLI